MNLPGSIDLCRRQYRCWTGAPNGNWTTTAKSCVAEELGLVVRPRAATDFVAGDAVIFDDTAPGTSSVNVTDANVQPALVVFNNSCKDYTPSEIQSLAPAA